MGREQGEVSLNSSTPPLFFQFLIRPASPRSAPPHHLSFHSFGYFPFLLLQMKTLYHFSKEFSISLNEKTDQFFPLKLKRKNSKRQDSKTMWIMRVVFCFTIYLYRYTWENTINYHNLTNVIFGGYENKETWVMKMKFSTNILRKTH